MTGAKPKPRPDDDDDLMDSLGLSSPRTEKPAAPKPASKGDEPRVGGAKSILDELLGKDTTARHLERPGTGERREFTLGVGASRHDDDKPTSAGKDDDDPLFDGYMPSSVASRPNSRRSVRCVLLMLKLRSRLQLGLELRFYTVLRSINAGLNRTTRGRLQEQVAKVAGRQVRL